MMGYSAANNALANGSRKIMVSNDIRNTARPPIKCPSSNVRLDYKSCGFILGKINNSSKRRANVDTSGSVKFTDLKKLIGEHLKNGLAIDHFVITYAEHVDTANQWKVDVEFKTDTSGAASTTAAIILDDKSGEVKTFLRGRKWS